MALNQRTRDALNNLGQRIKKENSRERFRPGTPGFAKALKSARGLLGVKYEDAERLAEHLASASRKDCNFLICIKCGSAGWKENAWMVKSPFEMVWESELRKQQLAGFSYAIQFLELKDIRPDDRLVIRNGFCQSCTRTMRRRFPKRLRDRREGNRPTQPVQVVTVEEAITVLQEHNIIYDGRRFKDALDKTKKIHH